MSEMHQAIHGNVSDGADRCPHCGCMFHGLPCAEKGCTCATSFEDRYADEGDAVA